MIKTDRLDPDEIKVNLNTKRIGREVLVYNSVSSTNDIAAQYATNKKNNGLVILAEEQTAGRGRAGTNWQSGPGDSILCSIVLTDFICKPQLLCLTSAIAVAEAIGKPTNCQAKIKWPNDIILGGKKVAGILLESKLYNNRSTYVIGIGINCHQKKHSFGLELQSTATSIDIESKTICDRISLTKRLLASMDDWLEAAQKTSEKVIDQWRRLSTQLGHRVKLVCDGRKFTGSCIGIDPQKGLVLQLETGGIKMFDAAHTTIIQ